MKVAAINGSPRLSKGHTAQVLEPFIEGMRKAGAEVSLIYASKLKIKPCIGDFSCWYNKPGECIFQDDMQSVYQLLTGSDMLILATPVYIPLPGAMQNLINRLCPLFEPILENRNGRTRAQFHSQIKIRKILLVATCAWWESGNFGTVKRIVEEMAVNANVEFAGAILTPHSFLLDRYPEDKRKTLASPKEADYQLARTSGIPPATLETIAKPLISFEDYIKDMNDQYFRIETSQKSHKQQ